LSRQEQVFLGHKIKQDWITKKDGIETAKKRDRNGKKCGEAEPCRNAGYAAQKQGIQKRSIMRDVPQINPGMTRFEKEGISRLSIKTGHACSVLLCPAV
jgi:hypothetical protein